MSEKKYIFLKYIAEFIFCTILFILIIQIIALLDSQKQEMFNCFLFEGEKIQKTFDYPSYIQGYCPYPQKCACLPDTGFIVLFYILAFPVFIIREWISRKHFLQQYAYFFILGEVLIWGAIYYVTQGNSPSLCVSLQNTWQALYPSAIVMATLHSLSSKILKLISKMTAILYGLFICFWGIVALYNFFN